MVQYGYFYFEFLFHYITEGYLAEFHILAHFLRESFPSHLLKSCFIYTKNKQKITKLTLS